MILKIKIVLLFFVINALRLNAQDNLIIHGSIDKSMDGKTISLQTLYPYPSVMEQPREIQSIVSNGKFFFSVPANGVELYDFIMKSNNKQRVQRIWLPPGNITIAFQDTILRKYTSSDNLNNEFLSMAKKRDSAINKNSFLISWIGNNINSPICTNLIYDLSYKQPNMESEVVRLYNMIPVPNRSNSWAKEVEYQIKNTFIGSQAVQFSEPDTAGGHISLSEYKGKYVLLDFWASWCVPCRAENPNVLKAYNKYHEKGFEILAVSLDVKKKDWIDAIHEDHLPWKHVSDLTDENILSSTYRVRSVPTNFLIDPSGKIIAKNLRGKALDEFLAKKMFN